MLLVTHKFRDYVETMMNVDRHIQKVVQKTESYFEKGSTAYIFTADHGMTDWGSHGSGSTDETETPFVAWGAGIAKDSNFYNIEQADITPLISTLVGIPVPVNNEVGFIVFSKEKYFFLNIQLMLFVNFRVHYLMNY